MKVVVDDKIPYIRGIIERMADEVVYAPGSDINSLLVSDADALIIRTRTRCDEALLRGSRVKFIATATIGYDHIDADYCARAGIVWTNAPGCNADSVAQYVKSALLLLQRQVLCRPLAGMTIGVVGVGHVGSRVARVAVGLGMHVLLNDPPRQATEHDDITYSPLGRLAADCDIITFHTPLSRGPFPTYHLCDEAFLRRLRRKPIIINTSRGEVVDNAALLRAIDEGQVGQAVIDVWEGEPHPNLELLQRVFLGTPHIAGYSADGKANATRMVLEAFARHFNVDCPFSIVPPPPVHPRIRACSREDAALQIYNPMLDSRRLKSDPAGFEYQRGHYPLRREEGAYFVETEEESGREKR